MTHGPLFRRRPEFIVDRSAPFKNDKLGFEKLVLPLTRLLEKTPGPYVIAVSAEYGTGKSTFLRMWQAYLEQEGARTLYFDAWAHDFVEPPLTALIGEVETQVANAKGMSEAKEKLHKSALAVLRALAPAVTKESIRVLLPLVARAIGGAAASDGVRVLLDKLADGHVGEKFGGAAAEHMKDWIKEYEQQKQTLEAFRCSLKGFAEAASGHGSGAAKSRFMPLVLFIDELDRCRPTYAIELLETVKHLFGVEGVVFVLGINREALGHSLQAVYGHQFDGTAYLRRFIDLSYYLPDPPIEAFCRQLAEEFLPPLKLPINHEYNYYEWANFRAEVPYRDVVALTVSHYARKLKRSLRDLEQMFSRAGAALATLSSRQHVEPAYFAFLMLVHDAAPEVYSAFRDGTVSGGLTENLTTKTKYRVGHATDVPLEVIIHEAQSVQHLKAEDIEIRRREYHHAMTQSNTRNDTMIAWRLLKNGYQRLHDATSLVDLAQQFGPSDGTPTV